MAVADTGAFGKLFSEALETAEPRASPKPSSAERLGGFEASENSLPKAPVFRHRHLQDAGERPKPDGADEYERPDSAYRCRRMVSSSRPYQASAAASLAQRFLRRED